MSNASVDRNLLFGILALQMDFITRDALIDALRDWTTQKHKPLGQILVDRGDLSAARQELLEPLVDEHVRQHNQDPAASLASVSSIHDGTIDWQQIGDVEIQDSLAARRMARDAAEAGGGKSELKTDGAGASLGRFRVLRPHARGGIGEVFLAFDEELHREVALKEIQSRHLRDESHRERFVREAEVTGGLEHLGIVPVYSLGHHGDGRPFYAMRFIRGDSLKEAIERFHAGPKPSMPVTAQDNANTPTVIGAAPPETPEKPPKPGQREQLVSREQFESVEFRKLLGRFIDVCQAIEYAHSRGVLHRDLKPGNIMLGKYGETLVVDWGLAKIAGKDERFTNVDEATLVPSSGSSIEHTADGSVIGTPAYMSPEQAAGRLEQLGPATDVYSLGATLYQILTGHSPFDKLPLAELLACVQCGKFPRPDHINPHVPRALAAVCLKAMALRAEDRYESSAAIAEDIEHWLADESVNAHREGRLAQCARWVRKHRAWAMSGAAALVLVSVVASIAAVWINGQKDIIARQERAATRSASRNAALAEEKSRLAEDKSKLADDKSRLAELEKSARQTADANARKAATEAVRANREADAAVRQTNLAKRHLYVAHMNLAESTWQAAHVGETIRLLDLYRLPPGQAGSSEDLRGFEWYHLDRLCHCDLFTVQDGTSGISTVAFCPDGKRLASSAYSMVKIWDAMSGQELLALKGHTGSVACVAFSGDGKRLASAGYDALVKLWDPETGQELFTLKGHSQPVNGVAFSPDGRRVASVDGDLGRPGRPGEVKVWDTDSGQEMLTMKGHTSRLWSVAFHPDGKRLASAGEDQMVKVWDVATGQESLTLRGHTGPVWSVVFSPDGNQLASASSDQTVRVWDVVTGRESLTLKGHAQDVAGVTFSPDGKRLATASKDQTVKLWDVVNGREALTRRGHTGGVSSVSFSPDGRRLASSGWDNKIKMWDTTTRQESSNLNGHVGPVYAVSFSPDGHRLASASNDQTVRLWNATTGRESFIFKGHTTSVSSVAFGPDGKRLASAGMDKLIKLWDADTGEVAFTLQGHSEQVVRVAFSPDGTRLASSSRDKSVKLWDTTTGLELRTISETKGVIWSLTFSPDGQRLAGGGVDGIKVWSVDTGLAVAIKANTVSVNCVAFSPSGEQLASGSFSEIKIWDAAMGTRMFSLQGHNGQITGLAFTPDGRRLASASYDGSVK